MSGDAFAARTLLICAALLFLAALPVFADHSIDINTADKATLTTLTGIGEVKAQAIIDYREANGPFVTIEDIQNVSGIGPATFAGIKDHIVAGASPASAPPPAPSPAPSPTPTSPSPAPSPSPSAPVPSYVAPPGPRLFADAGGDRTVIVGADVEFRGRAYDHDREIVNNVRFAWNFGDGSSAEGQAALHHFSYPGRYAVILSIAEDVNAGTDRVVVTAETAELAFISFADGSVGIENRSGHDLDLSRWLIRSFGQSAALPDNSIVLAGETLRIPQKNLGFWSGASTELAYPNGVLALRAGENTVGSKVAPSVGRGEDVPVSSASSRSSETSTVVRAVAPAPEDVAEPEAVNGVLSVEESAMAQTAAAGTSFLGPSKWLVGVIFVTGAGAASVFFARRYAKREWDIVEDVSE